MKRTTTYAIAALAATAAVTVGARAAGYPGYLTETNDSIVMSGTGLCWHVGEWTGPRDGVPCDAFGTPVAVAAIAPATVVAVAAPPAETPPVEPATPQPQPQAITFSADALFDFDQAVLKPEGKAMLDGLVRSLDGATYETIVATGHTDRFGSDAYNQALSERRAQAVKEYLVGANVPAARVEAQGKGRMQPLTRAGDCQGPKSAKVIACLQPDRRVDVEMTGSRIVTGSR